jgi:hypothetical protein
MTELLRREIELACPPAHAFVIFTDKIDRWWPHGHRKHRDGTLRFAGGRLVDSAADGSEWTMATVTMFDPPSRLALDWFPGSAAAPTHVEVTFERAASGTLITIVHRAISDDARIVWPQKVTVFEASWSAVLMALRDFIATGGGDYG